MPAFTSKREQLIAGENFSSFYARHSESLLVHLARQVLDPEVALDLTAEAFARAFEQRSNFKGRSQKEAAAWLYGIARNLLSHYFRDGVIERRALERLSLEVPGLSEADIERIDELADLDRLRRETEAGLSALTRGEREAVQMRVIDEKPYSEVANELGISQEAARARVSRGLKALAEFLEPQPEGEAL